MRKFHWISRYTLNRKQSLNAADLWDTLLEIKIIINNTQCYQHGYNLNSNKINLNAWWYVQGVNISRHMIEWSIWEFWNTMKKNIHFLDVWLSLLLKLCMIRQGKKRVEKTLKYDLYNPIIKTIRCVCYFYRYIKKNKVSQFNNVLWKKKKILYMATC